jgi:hypothetical protein
VFSRNYKRAESTVLNHIENLLKQHERRLLHTKEEELLLFESLFFRFNNDYLYWIRQQNKDEEKERLKQESEEHHNYLIAHCFDPASMDDLLWEVHAYIQNPSNKTQKKEIQYQLACYNKLIENH